MRIKTGIAGFGARGHRLFERMLENDAFEVVGIYDSDPTKKDPKYSAISWFDSYDSFLENCDAVVIATWPSKHYILAREALEKGLDVFVEKPSTLSSKDDESLEKVAKTQGRLVAVGYSERFNPIIEDVRQKIDFSEINLYEAMRINWPPQKKEYPGIERDLISHDLDLGVLFFGKAPRIKWIDKKEDRAKIYLSYGNVDAELGARLIEGTAYRYRMSRLYGLKNFWYLNYAEQRMSQFHGPKIPEIWRESLSRLKYEELLHMSRNVENVVSKEGEPIIAMLNWFGKCIKKGEIMEPLCPISDAKITTKAIEEALIMSQHN